ncbi:RNase adapter RapZ [Niveispirillum cyanobacteriorum]|uniref:RNase adapter RapZ n=1 Tax=Niveispirillum cyanobacteriorum TaxID=1612173 RepID=A0A2K9NCI0_9PROT|nr:RNase adapter RapZ [Niveispirillum cyanobacteriorum]AUN30814.1 RNase adapter RapZ [Niveispirillum cyanobacteriorum]GGE79812.1 nucleotide-binding protein [Niveispirillum cyanobacteriorum]
MSEASALGPDGRLPIVVATGMSGGGLSTAMKCLEDLGYEAVDNLRLSLLQPLVSQPHDRPLVIGIDSRTRDFNAQTLLAQISELRARPDLRMRVLFMDAHADALQRRYTETRRPHPLAADRPVLDGIATERVLMQPLRDAADEVVDTTNFSVHDTRRHLTGLFRLDGGPGLSIFVTSFAYRHGVPREADLVFDVRFLDNPHWDPVTRPLTGLDQPVADYITRDPDWPEFFGNLTRLLEPLLPRYVREGKHYLTIAVGCTGGRHRSVFTTHLLATWLKERGYKVGEAHRDLDRKAQVLPVPEDRAATGTNLRESA